MGATYANKAIIKRVVDAAREAGIDVAGFELHPDGTVRVFDARMAGWQQPGPSDWDGL